MFEILHDLTDWVIQLADNDWAVVFLGLTSFFESIFFPIPPDPLLIAMSIGQPKAALWFAVLVTVSSVAGALVGHWLGARLGRPLLHRWFADSKVATVESMFNRYGMWAILLAAITPLPYKLFAISAGALNMDRRTFLIASVIGRGVRFLTIGALLFVYGEPVEQFIDENFEILTVGAAGTLIAAALLAYAYKRLRTSQAAG